LELADLPLPQYAGRATYEPYYPHIWQEGGLDWYIEHCFGTPALQMELADPNVEYLLPYDVEGRQDQHTRDELDDAGADTPPGLNAQGFKNIAAFGCAHELEIECLEKNSGYDEAKQPIEFVLH